MSLCCLLLVCAEYLQWVCCCSNTYVQFMGVHVAAVFASGRSPRRPTELHIKQAVLWGLSSSLDTDPVSWQRWGGGWMDCGEAAVLASNFLTQKLSPRRFPLLPPQHSYSTHTLSIPLTSAGEANKQSLQWQHKETRSKPLNAASPHWLIVLRW